MNKLEFERFVEQASRDLQRKQVALVELWNMMDFKTYWFDQNTGMLQFKDAHEEVGLEASVIPIGSFSMKSNTWHWSWANQTLLPELRQKSARLKSLYPRTNQAMFKERTFPTDEKMALNLVAIAVAHLNCIGCYRMPMGQLNVYLAIERIDTPSSRKDRPANGVEPEA